MRSLRDLGIRAKIGLTFAAGCALIVAFTCWVAKLQFEGFERAAQLESTHLATAIAYAAAVHGASPQSYLEGMENLYKRDVFIVDAGKRVIADSASELGIIYGEDRLNEVGQTLQDGKPRMFVERSPQYPNGTKQVVVAMHGSGLPNAPITGAVILEYSNIAGELRDAGMWQVYLVAGGGLLSAAVVAGFGIRLGRSISDRLAYLAQGVAQVASGRYDVRLPIRSRDEIGLLKASFNTMAEDLESSRARLLIEIEKEKATAQQVEHLAYHDALTGLANRALFSKLVGQHVAEACRYGTPLSVMFVDLDRFKTINDSLGHEAGDTLLKEVARRLQSTLRASDVVARQGGDEFTVLIPSSNDPAVLQLLAEKLLASIALPLDVQGHEIRMTASVGISMFPRDGTDEPTLLKHADIAMYQAKDDGKNTFAFYAEEFDRHSVERLVFESSLRQALEQRQFEVHYQPKVDGRDGRITGVEALLRWHHPELGLVSPAKFIPVAEETGLIVPIGLWVLETACAQQVAWRRAGHPALRMAVNVSARQLDDDGLLADVERTIRATGIDAAHLEIEITESMLMRDVVKAGKVLAAFKALGVRLSVDDFGTGYSSLSTLKRFPVDAIKVDRSFVRDLPSGTGDQAMAEAIIAMGRGLGMTVVAEGVETGDQVDFLRARGCDEMQGFFYSKAVSASQLQELLKASPGGVIAGSSVTLGGRRSVDSVIADLV